MTKKKAKAKRVGGNRGGGRKKLSPDEKKIPITLNFFVHPTEMKAFGSLAKLKNDLKIVGKNLIKSGVSL